MGATSYRNLAGRGLLGGAMRDEDFGSVNYPGSRPRFLTPPLRHQRIRVPNIARTYRPKSRCPAPHRAQTLTTPCLRPQNTAPDIGASAAAHRTPPHHPLSDVPLRQCLLIGRSTTTLSPALEVHLPFLRHRSLRPPIQRTSWPAPSTRCAVFI